MREFLGGNTVESFYFTGVNVHGSAEFQMVYGDILVWFIIKKNHINSYPCIKVDGEVNKGNTLNLRTLIPICTMFFSEFFWYNLLKRNVIS